MKLKNLYSHSKCPHCGKFTISLWQKMSLVDYRYTYTCKECGGTIQLPVWHTILYLGETIMLIAIIVKYSLNAWQAILSGGILLLFIGLVQLPFIPIKG